MIAVAVADRGQEALGVCGLRPPGDHERPREPEPSELRRQLRDRALAEDDAARDRLVDDAHSCSLQARKKRAVASSAGKSDSIASSDTVTSMAVPKLVAVLMKASSLALHTETERHRDLARLEIDALARRLPAGLRAPRAVRRAPDPRLRLPGGRAGRADVRATPRG